MLSELPVNSLFKLELPPDFKPEQRTGAFVAIGPSDRQIQAGRIPWRSRFRITLPIVQLLIRVLGPEPFLGGLAQPARGILEANAEPGSLQIAAPERSRLGGSPALAIRARYTKAGQALQVRGYFSFSSGQPVYLFLIGTTNDAMDWAGQIADRMQLFK